MQSKRELKGVNINERTKNEQRHPCVGEQMLSSYYVQVVAAYSYQQVLQYNGQYFRNYLTTFIEDYLHTNIVVDAQRKF